MKLLDYIRPCTSCSKLPANISTFESEFKLNISKLKVDEGKLIFNIQIKDEH